MMFSHPSFPQALWVPLALLGLIVLAAVFFIQISGKN
jgi:hypothetical protein